MRVAVIGGGISGLGSSYVLAKEYGIEEVVLFEKEESLGGHAKTVRFDGVDIDIGFIVFNTVTYPNMIEFFKNLGVDMEVSDMSFSVSLDSGRGCEWGCRSLSSLFAQKRNIFSPYFWKMITEIKKFKEDVLKYLEDQERNLDMDRTKTLGGFLKSHGYSDLFQKAYLVMTQADLGLADAYINGDFSFVDKERGLLDLLMILIANKELNSNNSNHAKRRGWWTPMFLTASLASAKHFLKHASRQNTLTQARRNISRHYDLSNELFALFLDDTMTYSSAVFKSNDEDLRTAQMRKISLLIDKDRIKFELCDYRQLSDAHKYDRIISCEMLEAVGHEFMETFFTHCEAALAEDGIFVLQVVFSRPGNVAALGDPFHCFPSAQS
uniref:Amine oxidase domain-containing protein n=1 Tax=Brassica campestris TaxID=3711 RepID=M4E4M0_BRACM